MRIAVLSDTHGNYALAVRALDLLGDFDHIVHLGDMCDDAENIEAAIGRKLLIVAGNGDMAKSYPDSVNMVICGKRFLMCHGHTFQVKSGLARTYHKALENGTDIVLYGHTHIPAIEEINGILFMNPGTLKMAAGRATMGILSIEGNSVSAEIIDVVCLLEGLETCAERVAQEFFEM
jgi:putative phosphoesterase